MVIWSGYFLAAQIGDFNSAAIGDFRPAYIGDFRPTLTLAKYTLVTKTNGGISIAKKSVFCKALIKVLSSNILV